MKSNPVKVGIVGLGRWAKVLTRAARQSASYQDRCRLQPLGGEARRVPATNSALPARPTSPPCWPTREIKGVILTVPNEQHLPLAREVAKAGKHVYTEKPIASTLEEGLEIEALEKTYGVTVTVGHSARLMAGIRAHPRGDRRRRARPRRLHRGQFLQRARARAHAQDLALVQGQGAGRAAVAARDPSVRRAALSRRRDRRGELDGVQALAGRRRGRRPVDDAAPIRRRQGRLCRHRAGRRPACSRSACSDRKG